MKNKYYLNHQLILYINKQPTLLVNSIITCLSLNIKALADLYNKYTNIYLDKYIT